MRIGFALYRHKFIQLILIACCVLSLPFAIVLMERGFSKKGIEDVTASSLDGQIELKYEVFGGASQDSIRVSVADSGGY